MATVRQYRGRWCADFRDQHGRRRIEAPKGPFESKALERRAAQELLAGRLAEVQRNTFTPHRERVTIEKLAELWLASKVAARATTLDDYRIMVESYVLPWFAGRRVEGITRLDIETFRAGMAQGTPERVRLARDAKREALRTEDADAYLKDLKPGPRTTNKCIAVLVQMLNYATEHGLAARNVAANTERLPTAAGEQRVIESNVLTPGELRRVIDAAVDPYGSRSRWPPSPACARQRRSACSGATSTGPGKRSRSAGRTAAGRSTSRKTATSRRTVELPDELIATLKRWRLACPKEGNVHDLVCPAKSGKPMQGSALLQQGFLPALRRAGDPPGEVPRHPPLSCLEPAGGRHGCRDRQQSLGARQCPHHPDGLRPRRPEGSPRGHGPHGGTHGPGWKQFGNIHPWRTP